MSELDEVINMLADDETDEIFNDESVLDSDDPARPENTAKKKPPKKAKKAVAADINPLDLWFKNWAGVMNPQQDNLVYSRLVETHLMPLDVGLGLGGLPLAQIVTLFGEEGTGKTTMAQLIAGEIQRQYPNMIIVWVAGEAKWNPDMAERNGMDVSDEALEKHRLIIVRPDIDNGYSWEKMIASIEQMITPDSKTGLIPAPDGIAVFVDSMDAMSTQSEIAMEADDGGAKYGGMGKANSVTLKRLANLLLKTNSLLFIIQQARAKIGGYIPGIVTSGGHAILHYSRTRIELKRLNQIKRGKDDDAEIVGHVIKGKVLKNDYYRPYVQFEMELRYDFSGDGFDAGFDRAAGLVDVGIKTKHVAKHGAQHELLGIDNPDSGEPASFNGRENTLEFLRGNPRIADLLESKIRTYLYGS